MKKITLLLIFLYSLAGYCQFPESFEGSASAFPPGWKVAQNTVGTDKVWVINGSVLTPPAICDGQRAAQITASTSVSPGTKSEDYLITPMFTVPKNGQFRFFSRQGQDGDQGAKYQIRVSTNPDQNNLAAFGTVMTYTENQLNNVFNQCEENSVDISAFEGQQIYVAIVRVFDAPNPNPSNLKGDICWIDNVNVVSKCITPTVGTATNVAATTATLNWDDDSGNKWEIELVTGTDLPTGNPTIQNITSIPYNATGLTPNTAYCFYVRSLCAESNSEWAGPFCFKTNPLGIFCEGSIIVPGLPYQTSSNTGNFDDKYDYVQSTSGCGASPNTTNFMTGNDVFYSYTATETGSISIKLTPTAPNSSIFVYGACPAATSTATPAPPAPTPIPCLAGVANTNSTQRVINDFTVTAGTTYYIVISSEKTNQEVGYTLIIQKENCAAPVGNIPAAADLTTTTAKLSWSNPTSATNWEVAIQPLGSSIPTTAGIAVDKNPYLATDLKAGTKYQYYVRSVCQNGEFSSWSGPYPFNTVLCDDANKCLYEFKMNDTGANGWGGAEMQVRQNNIVVQTIGSTFATGSGPVTVKVGLCNDLPFDLFWSKAGSQPEQCAVSIINKFGQTIYTKAAGANSAGNVLYSNKVDCVNPSCFLVPTSLTATAVGTHQATLGWTAPSTTLWDVYVVPAGSPAPTESTVANYPDVTTNPLVITGLLADTCYEFYVKVKCDPTNAGWSAVKKFCTLPTCPKPTGLSVPVATITKTGADLYWNNGTAGDTKWEILLIKAVGPDYATPTTPSADYVPVPGADKTYIVEAPAGSPYKVTDLETATIYYYYIRTLCPGGDKSVWTLPYKFNTLTCLDSEKCIYKFVMTDAGGDGWNKSRIDVRQNGIIIKTLGSSISGSGPEYEDVALCNNVPFDLYWKTAGDKPQEVGLKVITPFQDDIYIKDPGVGTPGTVLFATTANCTAPSCPKMNMPNSIVVTTTSVKVAWTGTTVPGAAKWEALVVPRGTTPPANEAAIDPSHVYSENPFTISGLDPSTDYDFYIRAVCSDTEKSTWNRLSPKLFTTKPVNDDCDKPLVVPVNGDENCASKVSATTKGATSVSGTPCVGFADDDVWFSFVATSNVHVIDLSNIVGAGKNLNHVVYAGNDCGTMTQLYCSNPNTSVATNLVVGNTYKVRVYTDQSNITPGVVPATFDICITTPPPIVNDECDNATTIDVNADLLCTKIASGTLTGATASPVPNTCLNADGKGSQANDDVWYKFVAQSTTQYIFLKDVAGTTIDLNHSVYKGDCGNLTLMYCSGGNQLESNSKSFVVGQTYYLRVWSFAAESQKVNFNICIGSVPPPVTTSTTKYTVKELVEDVLLGTKCANVANVKSSTGTKYGSVNGIGYFDKSLSLFPFKDGIVMSSGNVLSVPGPNAGILSEGSQSWPGDADLEKIIKGATGAAMNSKNASILEFDFTPLTNKLSFNFLLASDEYGTFQCTYADAFAFLLTGPDKITKNLAVIEGKKGATPVSVVTIRDKMYNGSCSSENEQYFGQYYYDTKSGQKPMGQNGLAAPIDFNGMTVPLKAEADVIAGAKYHIKMVIADRSDTAYDSAVFLEGGSFDIGNINLGIDLLQSTDNALCLGDVYTIQSGLVADQYTFIWKRNNIVILGQTGPNLDVTAPGTYSLEAHYLGGACDVTDTVVIEYYPDITAGKPLDMSICDASGVGTFDLTTNSAAVLAPFTDNRIVTFYTSNADARNEENAIANATAFQNTVSPQTIYARVNKPGSTCYQIVTFTLTVADLTPKFTLEGKKGICPAESSTITVAPINNNFDPNAVQYSWSFGGNVIAGAESKSLTVNGEAAYGSYSVTVNNSGCTSTQTFEITPSTDVWNINFVNAPYVICPGQNVTMSFTAENFNIDAPEAIYTWTSPDGTKTVGKTFTTNKVGTYSVEVDVFGCKASESVEVTLNSDPIAMDIQSGCAGNDYQLVAVPVNGSFDPAAVVYEWKATNGGSFDKTAQENTIILNGLGTYEVTVTTADGCSAVETVTVIDINCSIQKGISPGGVNDKFDLSTLEVKRLEIFNRYGTEVYNKDGYIDEWHGQSNDGSDLPDGTYFYQIHYKMDNKETTGWIYINRKQ